MRCVEGIMIGGKAKGGTITMDGVDGRRFSTTFTNLRNRLLPTAVKS